MKLPLLPFLALASVAIFLFSISIGVHAQTNQLSGIHDKLKALEKKFAGKIGLYAINTNNNQVIAHRANERFPIQSTMKLIGVAALLYESDKHKTLLNEKIFFKQHDLVFWHPITGKYLSIGMTLASLSEAAMTYSDNTAMNLIMRKLGGPSLVTAFAHTIGNKTFNIEHYEGNLNSNMKNDSDTSTPKDMAISLQKLTLGNILKSRLRKQLIQWMRNNTTGYKTIRAGVPIGWVVADKTGSGAFGIANDIGLMWSPRCKPVVVAIYTVRNYQHAKARADIIALATQFIFQAFGNNDPCFRKLYT